MSPSDSMSVASPSPFSPQSPVLYSPPPNSSGMSPTSSYSPTNMLSPSSQNPSTMSPSSPGFALSPTNQLVSPALPMSPVTATPTPETYKEDPNYIQLKGEEQTINKQLVPLNKALADAMQGVKTAVNPVQKQRLDTKSKDLLAQVTKLQQRLQQITSEISAFENK